MTNKSELMVRVPMNEIQAMAQAVAKSGLFGIKTPEQALSLMLIAQAEGRHPALAARDYDIIQGRPAKKTEAMLRDFLQQDGKVEWHTLDDTVADATFSHPCGGSVRISWDMARVRKAKISNPQMYEKYPRAMLRSRTVSEGIRTVCPMATSGMYNPEELHGFAREKDITPSAGVEEQLTREETEKVDELAANMREWIEQGSIGDAVYELENAGLNAEQTITLWTRFDSKQRSAMKKEQARIRAAALAAPKNAASQESLSVRPGGSVAGLDSQPRGAISVESGPSATRHQDGGEPSFSAPAIAAPDTISAAAHKRLEARISELKLDREEVKTFAALAFGRAHFTELTKEEYRVVDEFVEIAGAETSAQLAAYWGTLSKDDKKLLTAIKDTRKAALESQQPVGEV